MTVDEQVISLSEISEKIYQHQRLSFEEGVFLLQLKDLEDQKKIISLANFVRSQKVGDVVHYASTLYIHPTNLCELNCPFCSYYAKPGWEKAWFMTPSQIEEKVKQHYSKGLTEIHIVGGLWRDCNLDYYEDCFSRIKKIDSDLHIKALTPVEYDFLARHHGISVEEVLKHMIRFGLGSLPGGGAEILVEKIRKQIAPGKISSEEYLAIHEKAHHLGLSSNITMLFGHIEDHEDIITHMIKIRELQDRTQGFKTFIPLKFGEENNALGKRKNRLKPKNIPLLYAVSRLMLDNIPHLKVLWNYLGIDMALEILKGGANDFSSTNLEEKIISMAGGIQIKMDKDTMDSLISGIGRIPKLTHTGNI